MITVRSSLTFSGGAVTLALLSGLMVFSGCSQELAVTEPPKRKVYKIATRQLPPEPVYGRTRTVLLPQVSPRRDTDAQQAPLLMPVVHMEVKDTPLKEAAQILAATSRYRSYCAPSIAKQKITLNSLGTIEELAHQIELLAGILVTIDHSSGEIRFMAAR